MVNHTDLEELEVLGFGTDIDALESYVDSLQQAASMGEPMVTEATYDQHIRLLKRLKPESELFLKNWEQEDFELGTDDVLLQQYGMASIQTIQSLSQEDMAWYYNNFASIVGGNTTRLMASLKLNGHGVRAVYKFGELVGGSTRGSKKKGRDILRHLRIKLPNSVSAWSHIPLLEVRGEALVSIKTFKEKLQTFLKTPLSSVTSLIRESASDEEIRLMDIVCYKIITQDQFMYESLSAEFEALEQNGFSVPDYATIDDVGVSNFNDVMGKILHHFENKKESGLLEFDSDGVVIGIDNNKLFYSGGKEGNVWRGNYALKAGLWESNLYCGIIDRIQFERGKTYLTPKAILDPGVVTANGARVTTVPLYNIGVMEKYRYFKGEKVYFKFGGETGVTCCTPFGERVNTKD